jgi:hypothetical protein
MDGHADVLVSVRGEGLWRRSEQNHEQTIRGMYTNLLH